MFDAKGGRDAASRRKYSDLWAKVTGTCILKRPSMARGSRKCVWIGGEGEESAGRSECSSRGT